MKVKVELTAGDVMSTPLVTLDKDVSLEEAAVTLSESRISGALVVDYGGRPIGVISLFDIVSYLSGQERPAEEPGGFYRYTYPRFEEGGEGWERGWEEGEVPPTRETPVSEVMSTEIISVPEDMPLEDVARTLWKRHIHRVFVSREGLPVGVITTLDAVRALSGGPRRERASGKGRE